MLWTTHISDKKQVKTNWIHLSVKQLYSLITILPTEKENIYPFNNFWHEYFWHNWPSNDRLISHPTQCHVCFCTTWGKQNYGNLAFYPNMYYYLNKITHKNCLKYILLTLLSLFMTVYPTILFSDAYSKKCAKLWPITRTQAWGRFLLWLTAVQ